jgi:hypothetical protein
MATDWLPVFESEQEFQDYLEKQLEEQGYTAIQEVKPHRSNYRVDLLLLHDDYGKIGIELKYLTGGTDAANAHRQIVDQYSGRKYLGDKVIKWVFAPYMPKLQSEQEHTMHGFQKGKHEVLQHMFQSYGIGFLDIHSSPYCTFDWGKGREYKMPAFKDKPGTLDESNDFELEAIDERSRERLIRSCETIYRYRFNFV